MKNTGEVETLHDLAKEIAALQLGPKCRVEVVFIQVKKQTTLDVRTQGAYPRTARELVDQRIGEGYQVQIVDDWYEIVAYEYDREHVPFGGDEITNEHPF